MLLSANAFNSDVYEILSFGKELRKVIASKSFAQKKDKYKEIHYK